MHAPVRSVLFIHNWLIPSASALYVSIGTPIQESDAVKIKGKTSSAYITPLCTTVLADDDVDVDDEAAAEDDAAACWKAAAMTAEQASPVGLLGWLRTAGGALPGGTRVRDPTGRSQSTAGRLIEGSVGDAAWSVVTCGGADADRERSGRCCCWWWWWWWWFLGKSLGEGAGDEDEGPADAAVAGATLAAAASDVWWQVVVFMVLFFFPTTVMILHDTLDFPSLHSYLCPPLSPRRQLD